LDGKGIAAQWKREVAAEVAEVTARAGRPPGLAVVLVGGRPDSKIYVRRKEEACEKARRPCVRVPALDGQALVPGSRAFKATIGCYLKVRWPSRWKMVGDPGCKLHLRALDTHWHAWANR